MKQTLSVLALFIAIGFANNFSDNPSEQIQPKMRYEKSLGIDSTKVLVNLKNEAQCKTHHK